MSDLSKPAFGPADPYQPSANYPTAPAPGQAYGGPGPGSASYGGAMPRPQRFGDINANWGWVVVACLFFWPLGFSAASAAGRVVPALLDGDVARAHHEAAHARKLGIVALCIAVAVMVLFFAAVILLSANGSFDCQVDDPNC